MPGRGRQAGADDILYGDLEPRGITAAVEASTLDIDINTKLLRLQDYFTGADGFSGNASWAVKADIPHEWFPEGAEESEYLGDEFSNWRVDLMMAGAEKCQFDTRGRDDFILLDKGCAEQRKAIEALAQGGSGSQSENEWHVIESENGEVFALYVTDTGDLLGQITL